MIDRESVKLGKGILMGSGLNREETIRFISILQTQAHLLGDLALGYKESFSAAASEMGILVPEERHCANGELETVLSSRLIEWDKPTPKENGIVRGLKHGFYRRMTISQIIELVKIGSLCDELVLLIENNERVERFKGKETDKIRLAAWGISGVADKVGEITGQECSDEFYRKLVELWRPDVYFVNESSGREVAREATLRANLVGGKAVVLPEVGINLHTSIFEKPFLNIRCRQVV